MKVKQINKIEVSLYSYHVLGRLEELQRRRQPRDERLEDAVDDLALGGSRQTEIRHQTRTRLGLIRSEPRMAFLT